MVRMFTVYNSLNLLIFYFLEKKSKGALLALQNSCRFFMADKYYMQP
jgi:hypothetical protein